MGVGCGVAAEDWVLVWRVATLERDVSILGEWSKGVENPWDPVVCLLMKDG